MFCTSSTKFPVPSSVIICIYSEPYFLEVKKNYNREVFDYLQDFYEMISGPGFEVFWRIGEMEQDKEEIKENMTLESSNFPQEDESLSDTSQNMENRVEMVVEDFYNEAKDNGYLNPAGELTGKGQEFYRRAHRGMMKIYDSDVVPYQDEVELLHELMEGDDTEFDDDFTALVNPENMRTIGEQYAVLATPGVLEAGSRLVFNESLDREEDEDIEQALEVLQRNGYIQPASEADYEQRITTAGRQVLYDVVFSPVGDYNWAEKKWGL